MSVFTRKNVLMVTAVFTAADGSATQPSAAYADIAYNDLGGLAHTATISLNYLSSSNEWVGLWDSSAAGNCTPNWVVYGTGPLQAAAQGAFQIIANTANVV